MLAATNVIALAMLLFLVPCGPSEGSVEIDAKSMRDTMEQVLMPDPIVQFPIISAAQDCKAHRAPTAIYDRAT